MRCRTDIPQRVGYTTLRLPKDLRLAMWDARARTGESVSEILRCGAWLWLQTPQHQPSPLGSPYTLDIRVHLFIPPDLRQALRQATTRTGISASEILRQGAAIWLADARAPVASKLPRELE